MANLSLNQYDVKVNNVAVGLHEGVANLVVSETSGWSTLAAEPPGGFAFLSKMETRPVSVINLDGSSPIIVGFRGKW